jgi:uncharacterized membrane protein (UPF0127 family)
VLRFWIPILCLVCVSSGWGCRPDSAPPAAAPPQIDVPGRAQARLPVIKLWVGSAELSAEVARTAEQLQTGMMFRTQMGEDDAMLFVFPAPHRAGFWMRNTALPLSCAYIGPDGAILELHDMKPKDEQPIVAGTDQIQFVLETRQGWYERHQVRTGMVVRTERGGLAETLLRRP